MAKKKTAANEVAPVTLGELIDENLLFESIAAIIETSKVRAFARVNSETTLMFWEIGQYINTTVLGNKRAEYGKQILTTLSAKLVAKYGKNFGERNIYRMTLFAERFADAEILPMLSAKLSWSHILELLPLKTPESQLYYATEAADRNWGVHELRRQILRKAYERREIPNAALSEKSAVPFNVFKDPYVLNAFGLKDNYLEADFKKAILADLEAFILEFGHGFTFADRQKRMIINGEDIVLDLLFYHRILKRLVAVEFKLGKFKAAYTGQMLLYLKWLNRYERQPGEEAPIGIILCATANREKIELLEMDKQGIAVAEYWTHLPPKAEFEAKIKAFMVEAKECLACRKSIESSDVMREIDFFLEPKDDTEDE